MPISESLRHAGLPYGYVSDRGIGHNARLSSFPLLILPEIACLSNTQIDGITAYVEAGGNLVILGDLGSATGDGEERKGSLLSDYFGIRIVGKFTSPTPLDTALPPRRRYDEAAANRFRNGALRPVCMLDHAVKAEIPGSAEVLGRMENWPGIVSLPGFPGNVLWLAGFPFRTATHPVFQTPVLNLMHDLFADLAGQAAGAPPVLRVNDWPPDVPMRRLRPFDHRYLPTFEFFPLDGEKSRMALITSYFKEPASFSMALTLPSGQVLRRVTELLTETEVSFEQKDGEAVVPVRMDFETAARVYHFELN